jgi:CRP-like cAMP-binding protein
MSQPQLSTKELRDAAALSAVGEVALAQAAAIARYTAAQPGDTLLREGVIAHHAFVIRAGHARVFVDGEPVATIGPGSLIGDLTVTGETSSSTVRAVTSMELVLLGPDALALIASGTRQ